MAKTGIVWDDKIWRGKIRRFARENKRAEVEFVREQSGLFMRDITKAVPPYEKLSFGGSSMGSSRDKAQGELALKSDLEKIFFVPKDRNIYNWAKKQFPSGPIFSSGRQTGAGVARSIDDMRKHHNRYQLINGRTIALRGPQRLWVSDTLFKRYFNAEKRKVGIAKASTAKIAIRFNPKIRVAAWIRRNMGKAFSSARVVASSRPTAIWKASADGLQHVTPRMIAIAKNIRLAAMKKRLEYLMRQSAKKSGLKVR